MGWAGPLTTRHMADMGADVIKVESCERFDWWRSWEATPEWIENDGAEKSVAFNTVNRNKRDITLDLEHPEGRQILLQLVGSANAVVENFSGGVLPKLNLGYEVFREVKNDIILLSMPAFGSTGPWKNFRAYGSTVEQASGLPHLNGEAADPPTMHHVAYGDANGGLNGAAALLVALRHQKRTGEGQLVDISQVESMFPLAAHGILEFAATGEAPARRGNASQTMAPHGTYPCEGDDAWIVIQVMNEDQWVSLQQLVGNSLEPFGALADRIENRDQLDQLISDWTRNQEPQQLMFLLQKNGIPAAATHTSASLLADVHLKSRGYWQWLDRAVVGKQPNPSLAYRQGTEPFVITSPAPTLGQHNEEVLADIIGMDEADLVRLRSIGIIGNRPRMRSV